MVHLSAILSGMEGEFNRREMLGILAGATLSGLPDRSEAGNEKLEFFASPLQQE